MELQLAAGYKSSINKSYFFHLKNNTLTSTNSRQDISDQKKVKLMPLLLILKGLDVANVLLYLVQQSKSDFEKTTA